MFHIHDTTCHVLVHKSHVCKYIHQVVGLVIREQSIVHQVLNTQSFNESIEPVMSLLDHEMIAVQGPTILVQFQNNKRVS